MSPLTAERPKVKLAGLDAFKRADDMFEANNERSTIVTSASRLMDLVFITNPKLSNAERCTQLEQEAEKILRAVQLIRSKN